MLLRSLAVAGFLAAAVCCLPCSHADEASPGNAAGGPNLKVVAKGFVQNAGVGAIVGVCRSNNGDLLTAYNTYTDLNPGQKIGIVRSTDGGATWGEPVLLFESVFRDGGVEAGSTLTRLANGRLLLPYTDGFYLHVNQNYDRHTLLFCPTSDDDGKTWQNTKAISFEGLEGFAFGKVVELPDNSSLLPLWGAYDRRGEVASGVLKSTDGGNTWSGERFIARRSGSETPIALLSDGRVAALLRQYMDDPARPFHLAYSSDGGDRWTSPVRVEVYGEAPALHVTPKGRLLAGYRTLQSRCHVNSSSDGGLTWSSELELQGPEGRAIGEYPAFENLPDGRILVVYDDGKPSWHTVYNILEED